MKAVRYLFLLVFAALVPCLLATATFACSTPPH
jgi:hypothetical protein